MEQSILTEDPDLLKSQMRALAEGQDMNKDLDQALAKDQAQYRDRAHM